MRVLATSCHAVCIWSVRLHPGLLQRAFPRLWPPSYLLPRLGLLDTLPMLLPEKLGLRGFDADGVRWETHQRLLSRAVGRLDMWIRL